MGTDLIILICLIAVFVILCIILQNYESGNIHMDINIKKSLDYTLPRIEQCMNKKHTATMINIQLDRVHEESLVRCYSSGVTNLEEEFLRTNSKTLLTGNDVVALVYSEKNGLGALLGMIPSPQASPSVFQKKDMMPKSIVVKRREDISQDEINKLEIQNP